MRIIMLGTGNAGVTRCYNTCFVIEDEGRRLLVDGGGGNGILSQLDRVGIAIESIHEVFVTHQHTDHILGILWVIRIMCRKMRRGVFDGEAFIYGHEDVIRIIRSMALELLGPKMIAPMDDRLHLVTVEDGETRSVIGHTTTFFDIQSTKMKQFGFSMDLDRDGTQRGEARQGDARKLTCLGDEPYRASELPYAQGATWLLHEAFCLRAEEDVYHPHEISHSTVADACEDAERLGVENLVLYHTEDKNIARRKELYRVEGAPLFSGMLYVPDDLEVIEL